MRIAVVAFGHNLVGDRAIGLEVVSQLRRRELPECAVVLDGSAPVLKTLESISSFDGLVIIDAASMGEPPGTVRTFSLNEIILAETGNRINLHGVSMDSELLYANKYLSLPPTIIIAIEVDTPVGNRISDTLLSNLEGYVKATTRAVARLCS
jgi:hydrogenase maturation protease